MTQRSMAAVRGAARVGAQRWIGWLLPMQFQLLLSLMLVAAAPAAALEVPDTLAQRLQACTVCHGREGRAAADGYHPRLAGKPAGYLYNQLLNFQDGRRHYGPMVALVQPLTPAYLQEIARYFSALELPNAAPANAAPAPPARARAERLLREGDHALELPACQACHGAALTGMLPATPGLLGLPRDYLVAQLGAWRLGQRQAHAPDCMGTVARRLAPEDVAALAAWLSAQPVPQGAAARAAPAPQQPRPLRCGSGEGADRLGGATP